MAPAATYLQPQVQLGLLFIAARRRGMDFEDWWWEAVREGRSLVMTNHPDPPPGCVRWPTDRNDRVGWQYAITTTKDCWRRSYERLEPTPQERAVGTLGEAIGALEAVSEERAAAELGEEPDDGLPARDALLSAA